MNKVNPWIICRVHFSTVFSGLSGLSRASVLFVFFVLPLFLGLVLGLLNFELKDDHIAALVSVFSVFAALLFSAQIAIYTVATRVRKPPEDKFLREAFEKKEKEFREFAREANANISYLILLSCIVLILFMVFFIFDAAEWAEGPIVMAVSVHFFLTLIMVVKRCFVAFEAAYQEDAT